MVVVVVRLTSRVHSRMGWRRVERRVERLKAWLKGRMPAVDAELVVSFGCVERGWWVRTYVSGGDDGRDDWYSAGLEA